MPGDETIIGSDPISSEPEIQATNVDTGARLKAIREAHGFSQRELAKRAGITNSNISMIEQGLVSPSVQSLTRILGAFPMTLADFFGAQLAGNGTYVYSAQELLARQQLSVTGVMVQRLGYNNPSRQLDIQIQILPAGFISSFTSPCHALDCCGFVVEGNLQLIVGTKSHELVQGDGFYIPASMAYRLRNLSLKPAKIIACSLFIPAH